MDDAQYYDKVNETHQIESTRQRKLRKRNISYIVLVFLILVSFFYLCYRYLFKINSIEYIGLEYYTAEELSEAFGVKEGDRLFVYSKKEKETLLLEKFPYLSECEIKRTVPDKITVTVKERESIMYTYVSQKYVVFDKDMVVVELRENTPEGLLKVEFKDGMLLKCILGQEIVFDDEKTGVAIYKVYQSLSSSEHFEKVLCLNVKSRFDFYLNYADKYDVYLGDSNDCDSKLLFLGGIIKKLYEEDSGKIDISDYKKGSFIDYSK